MREEDGRGVREEERTEKWGREGCEEERAKGVRDREMEEKERRGGG